MSRERGRRSLYDLSQRGTALIALNISIHNLTPVPSLSAPGTISRDVLQFGQFGDRIAPKPDQENDETVTKPTMLLSMN